MNRVRFLGLDVHAATIAVALAEQDGTVRALGTVPNTPEALRKLVQKLGGPQGLQACYEAGPCGYAVYWQLTELEVACLVVAPTLIPQKAGDRVKTDRRDAEKLARGLRAGELTAVWVPDAAQEALRDLVRARLAAKRDQVRHRHRLGKFLLRHGRRPPPGMRAWTQRHLDWAQRQPFAEPAQQAVLADHLHEVQHAGERIAQLERAIQDALAQARPEVREVVAALGALRGIATLSAVTIVAEAGPLSRFTTPAQLMAYAGVVSREHSSGARVWRGAITKTGNAHLRRVVIEAAWAYRHRPAVTATIRRRQGGLSPEVTAIAWKAQQRLHARYGRLVGRGKSAPTAVTAMGRELLGFIWAIAVAAERQHAA